MRKELNQLQNHQRMSIGEIAMVLYKSESQMMGQVADVSLGGIAFKNTGCRLPASGKIELDLLMTEQGLYLHNLPFVVPRKMLASKTGARAVLKFKRLDPKLKNKLRELMAYHIR